MTSNNLDFVARCMIGHNTKDIKSLISEVENKQNALSSTQLDAVNSGIDSTKVVQITTNKNNILSIQQTIGDINTVLEEVL